MEFHYDGGKNLRANQNNNAYTFSRPTSSTLETRKVVVMRKLSLACVALVCFIGALFTTIAQTPRTAEQQNSDRIVISKDEVLFDLVVRDKKGKLIKDLAQQDFEVYEDGVKQDINSFRFVSSTVAETATPAANNTSTPGDPTVTKTRSVGVTPESSGVSAVALVFDRLSPESRLRARDAALNYLGESVKKNELVGVFLTDLSVVVLQPYTYDSAQVKTGIEKAGVRVTSQYPSTNEEARANRTIVSTDLMPFSFDLSDRDVLVPVRLCHSHGVLHFACRSDDQVSTTHLWSQ